MDLNWIGDEPDEGQRLIDGIFRRLEPDAQRAGIVSLTTLQSEFDDFFRHGNMSYHTSGFFNDISDEAFTVLMEQMAVMSSPEGYFGLLPLGGAVARVAPDATAFPHREAEWSLTLVSVWKRPQDTEESIAWARESHSRLQPFMTGGEYVNDNDMGDDDPGRSKLIASYGPLLPRLRRVKAAYDPDNVFRGNQNIQPAD
jgi:FAD/FMN-containing dehydrogenase